MIYLAIIVLGAIAGIARLWVLQRRERDRMEDIDEFWTSLEKITTEPPPLRPVKAASTRPARPTARPASKAIPLDPARRAAAKRRIEARRAARTRAAG